MSKTYKGDVTGNVVELNLLDANEGTLPNLGTPTVVTKNTGPNDVTQVVGDIPANWKQGDSSLKGLVIGSSCTSIGSTAFEGCTGLYGSLVIPDSVTTIGSYAFRYSSNLTGSLTIPNSVESIGDGAFNSCIGFNGSLTIGNSVTTIGSTAFNYCSYLTGSLTIPDSVTSIGNYAFAFCYGLTGPLTIPDSVTNIGSYAFSYCTGFTGSLTIGNSVTSIGSNAFYAGNFDKLVVGSGVTSIGNYAFGSNLIPVAYASCPASAFVGSVAFYQCSSLTTLYARDAVANGYTLGSQSFEGATLTVANWDNYPNPIPN